MAATRKLQGEIERCLKKVTEGVETFEDIWTKVSHAANSNQKEKHEADLKKEIKKLQRLRDQIKTWQASTEVKDKTSLVEHRKLIETQMERFKGLERETKTKAYSKEGLGAAVKLDPVQKLREDCTRWLSSNIEQLNVQIDQFEAEMDGLTVKKKRDRDKSERLDTLKHWIERHRFHIKKLETLLRMLDNNAVDIEAIQKIREDVEYYTESNQEPDFDENEYIYSDIDMESVDEVFINDVGMTDASRCDDQSETANSLHSGSSPSPLNTAASTGSSNNNNGGGGSVSHSSSENADDHTKRTRRSISDDASSSTSGSHNKTRHSSKQQSNSSAAPFTALPATTPISSTSTTSGNKAVTSSCSSPSASSVTSRPTATDTHVSATVAGAPNFAAVAAATSHSALSSAPHQALVVPSLSSSSSSPSPSLTCTSSSLSLLASSSSSTSVPSSAGARSSSSSSSSSLSTISSAVLSSASLVQPSAGPLSQSQSVSVARLLQQQQQVNGDKSSLDATLAVSKVLSKQQHQLGSGGSSVLSDQHLQQRNAGSVSTALALSSISDTLKSAASTQETHIPTLYSVAPLGPVPMTKEHNYQFQMLQAAFYHMPHPSDSERLRTYLPRNPYPTPPYLPQVPPAGSDSFEFFMKLSVETLFFIFYYMEGTKAQYLAAKSLKKQSWRFHTKYMMWFQRHDEPKLITDEFEQGTYIFFDFEKWTQRRKEGFKFEYKFLEDRDLN